MAVKYQGFDKSGRQVITSDKTQIDISRGYTTRTDTGSKTTATSATPTPASVSTTQKTSVVNTSEKRRYVPELDITINEKAEIVGKGNLTAGYAPAPATGALATQQKYSVTSALQAMGPVVPTSSVSVVEKVSESKPVVGAVPEPVTVGMDIKKLTGVSMVGAGKAFATESEVNLVIQASGGKLSRQEAAEKVIGAKMQGVDVVQAAVSPVVAPTGDPRYAALVRDISSFQSKYSGKELTPTQYIEAKAEQVALEKRIEKYSPPSQGMILEPKQKGIILPGQKGYIELGVLKPTTTREPAKPEAILGLQKPEPEIKVETRQLPLGTQEVLIEKKTGLEYVKSPIDESIYLAATKYGTAYRLEGTKFVELSQKENKEFQKKLSSEYALRFTSGLIGKAPVTTAVLKDTTLSFQQKIAKTFFPNLYEKFSDLTKPIIKYTKYSKIVESRVGGLEKFTAIGKGNIVYQETSKLRQLLKLPPIQKAIPISYEFDVSQIYSMLGKAKKIQPIGSPFTLQGLIPEERLSELLTTQKIALKELSGRVGFESQGIIRLGEPIITSKTLLQKIGVEKLLNKSSLEAKNIINQSSFNIKKFLKLPIKEAVPASELRVASKVKEVFITSELTDVFTKGARVRVAPVGLKESQIVFKGKIATVGESLSGGKVSGVSFSKEFAAFSQKMRIQAGPKVFVKGEFVGGVAPSALGKIPSYEEAVKLSQRTKALVKAGRVEGVTITTPITTKVSGLIGGTKFSPLVSISKEAGKEIQRLSVAEIKAVGKKVSDISLAGVKVVGGVLVRKEPVVVKPVVEKEVVKIRVEPKIVVPSLKVPVAEKVVVKEAVKVEPVVKVGEGIKVSQRVVVGEQVALGESIKLGEGVRVGEAVKQAQSMKQVQALKESLALKAPRLITPRTGFKIRTPPFVPPPIIPLPSFKLKPIKKPLKPSEGVAFDVYVRRKGKKVLIGKKLPFGRATLLGKKVTAETVARSFVLQKTGVTRLPDITPPSLDQYRLPKYGGKVEKEGYTFVEKSRFAIDTAREKAELKAAKMLKKRFK